jgi:two-component system, LytTR family, response regulator
MKAQEKVRILIVDDEPLAREGLRTELLSDREIEIVGECANGREAVSFIEEHAPDLILLDVQMPVLDGFAVIEALGAEQMPVVIFVTAHDEYAVRAFEAHALDYLLKPINRRRLHESIERAKKQLSLRKNAGFGRQLTDLLQALRADGRSSPPRYLERVAVKANGRILFLKTADIDWIESEDNYVRLHRKKESYLVRETLSGLADKLAPGKFLRIRRSTLVNIGRVKELRPLFNREYIIVLEDGQQLRSSRRFRKNLDFLLQP